MGRNKSQCDRILERLEDGYSITQEDCDNMVPKIKRLAARIGDLKELGHEFDTKMIKTPGGARVAKYRLKPVQPDLFLDGADVLYADSIDK